MAESQLTLTAEEREFLVTHLEQVLKDTRIEEHRTRAPTYREHIIQQENQIVSLLTKLGRPPE
jgi:hypothetical protein